MFELQIPDTNVSSSSLAVSWCTDLETIKAMLDKDVKNPQVVIITAPAGEAYSLHKEMRHVVPLKDLVAYLGFKVVGENKIWAFITTLDAKAAQDRYLSKTEGAYYTW